MFTESEKNRPFQRRHSLAALNRENIPSFMINCELDQRKMTHVGDQLAYLRAWVQRTNMTKLIVRLFGRFLFCPHKSSPFCLQGRHKHTYTCN